MPETEHTTKTSQPAVQLAELRKDVKNLADIVNEMRIESKEWREKQVQILQTLASARSEYDAVLVTQRQLLLDVESLKAWRWYMAGICAAIAFAMEKLVGGL